MPATNWHKLFWRAVMAQFAASPGPVALVPDGLWLDSVPEINPNTKQPIRFPRLTVTQIGGSVNQTNCGPAEGTFFIRFECDAMERALVEQILWEIAEAFDNWSGDYPGIKITQVMRDDLPNVGELSGPGEFGGTVDFSVNFEGA